MKNKSARIPLGLRVVLMSILIALFAHGIFAEEKRGIIRDVEIGGYRSPRLEISVDTDGNRIPDHILTFPDPSFGWAGNLRRFAEKGMEIIFDNSGSMVAPGGTIFVNGDNTISIDGSNMIELFPNEAARFKFAAEALRRTQAPASLPPAQPQSAEERRIAELEAELQRLKQGR